MDTRPRILAVDDDANTLEVVSRNLTAEGHLVLSAADVQQALAILDSERIDLVVTDLKMPRVSGLDLVRHVRENLPDTAVMMITGYATVNGAVEAVKTGAEEYLAKPFTDEELLSAVRRALEKLNLRRTGHGRAGGFMHGTYGLLGESAAMARVVSAIEKAAQTAATVLITGESGTGKELVARAIHYSGPRASAPFVPINCGSIPENLLESELFGHVKGAFTGATESRAGFFQTADGGTIFLDEVGETGLPMQVKLLRVLQDREIRMVGSSSPRTVDVRVIAATNKDLSVLVKKGALREDLLFRLNVLPIAVPPLRERGDDVLLLARHFLQKFAQELEEKAPAFADDALAALRRYHWPGNVRELENTIQRAMVMSEGGAIEAHDLPAVMRFAVPRELGLNRTLAEAEAEHVRNVLASVGGNKTHAAQILGIDRKTLRKKLELLGDDPV